MEALFAQYPIVRQGSVPYSGVSDRTYKTVPFFNSLRFDNNYLYKKKVLDMNLIPLEKIYNLISKSFINECRFKYSIYR